MISTESMHMFGNESKLKKVVLRTTDSMTLTCKINGVQSGINVRHKSRAYSGMKYVHCMIGKCKISTISPKTPHKKVGDVTVDYSDGKTATDVELVERNLTWKEMFTGSS